MAGCKPLQRVRHFDAPERRLHLRRLEPAFLGELAEGLADRVPRDCRSPGLSVINQRARAALRKHLDDAAAHGAGAGDCGDEIAAGDVEHGRGKRLF